MNTKINIEASAINTTALELNLNLNQVNLVLEMLANGDTVPFIARYRQNLTKGLNEEQIYKIDKLYKYYESLNKRKEAIINILSEKKLLTDDLLNKINQITTKSDLESLYEPFKVGKKTKASQAIELGLEPLAQSIYQNKNPKFDAKFEAKKYLNDKIPTIEFALEQANYIIAQWISQNTEIKDEIKKRIYSFGVLKTTAKKNKEDPKEKFKLYYDFKLPIKYLKNHNILAINRAVNLNIVLLSFDYKFDHFVSYILYILDRKKLNEVNLKDPIIDSLKRLILPSVEREIFSELFVKAETSAIQIFSNSVEKLLNTPAIDNITLLSIDPGFKNGCKIAVLNKNGDLLEVAKIYPTEPRKEILKSQKIVLELIKKHNVDIIVIGNGTASRETEKFISDLIKEYKLTNLKYTIVSEVGASIYSASQVAIDEFPELSVEERSAVNIGRKFLYPLNEYVKIDPKSIGVGQYQHDVNQKELDHYLTFKVQKVVNKVGVDLNLATKEILTYISGLSSKHAQNIIEHRKEKGEFKNRLEVLEVKGIGQKTYEQAIGFLRILNSNNFLDKTFIHPDLYHLANKIIDKYNLVPNDNGLNLTHLDPKVLASELQVEYYDVKLILEALSSSVQPIKRDKTGFILKSSITNFEDLTEGEQITGFIDNITDFGIFAYIGLKESLFIPTKDLNLTNNLSQHEAFAPGQIINATITNLDKEKKRISGKLISF
ncbi:RNA (S1 domain)-binding protein [Mycoplasmopsis bovirhinis]|uniref:RNA (S1 domain)-binding protein n=1 Tax=Mycoplasmopsis bovirhinis TaxID=29553 RepID=A0A449AC65_9BACT|nr:Tex-like N-terminal domain-containing protein [Mycoplasmopsis bovirhinis]VEU62539.1 RNA (S1 domain)-binding protein [Mycoplasmopsis bovirhinis]